MSLHGASVFGVIDQKRRWGTGQGGGVFKLSSFLPYFYSVFQWFSKAKSANGGSILRSSQFLMLPQLPQKIKLASKVVKVDSKIII
jgi:hypothetical protein